MREARSQGESVVNEVVCGGFLEALDSRAGGFGRLVSGVEPF